MIIAHLGAHRTGTTLFQKTFELNRQILNKNGIQYIGPKMLRSEGFPKLTVFTNGSNSNKRGEMKKSVQKLGSILDRELQIGHRVLISEENFLGSIRQNFLHLEMYPGLQERLIDFLPAFEKVDKFYFTIRPLTDWWNSCFAYAIQRFQFLPSEEQLDQIVDRTEGWCFIINSLFNVYPNAEITIAEYGTLTASPIAQLSKVSLWDDLPNLKHHNKKMNSSLSAKELQSILQESGYTEEIGGLLRHSKREKLNLFSERNAERLNSIYKSNISWIRNLSRPNFNFVPVTQK